MVLESKERDLLRPKILLLTGNEGLKDEPPAVIDLKSSGVLFIRRVYDDYGKMKITPLDRDERPSVLFRKYRAPRSMEQG